MKMLFLFNNSFLQFKKSVTGLTGLIMLLAGTLQTFGATYYSRVATGNFAAVGSWSTSPTGTPVNAAALVATDVFIIQSGHNITVAAGQTVAGITINTGGTLTSGAAITLIVNGPWVKNGTFTPSTGTVTFGGASAAINVGTGTANFNNISIASGTTLTINTPVTAAGTFIYAAVAASSIVSLSGSGTLTVTGDMSMPRPSAGFTCTFAVGAGTLTVNGIFTMSATVTGRDDVLSISTGTVNLAAVTTGTTGCLFTFTGAGTLNISGTVSTGPPTITPSTGKVSFTGAGAQNIWGVNYYDLEFSGAGTKTIIAGLTATIANNWIVNSPVTMATTAIANVTGNVTGSGNITVGSGTIFLEGSWTNNGTLTPGTGTISYDGTGDQTIAALPYYKLATATGGTKTLAANVTATNTVTIGASTILDLSTFTLFLPFTGAPLVNSGTISGSGAVNYSGTGAQTVLGTTYTNLEFSGAGTKTIPGTTAVVTGNWIVGSPASLTTTGSANVSGNITGSGAITMVSGTISLAGSWTNNGTFTPGTGTVNYDGAGNQTIAALTYAKLQTATGGIKSLTGNTTANNVVTIGASTTLDLSTFTLFLTFTGAPLVNSGTISGAGEVNYSGANQTVAGTTYSNLELSGSGTKTVLAGTTVTTTGDLIVNSATTLTTTAAAVIGGGISGAGTLTAGSGTISIAGDWTKTGTFTPGTSIVLYNGTNQIIGVATYYKLQTSNAGTKTLAGSISPANTVTVDSPSILNLDTYTLTLPLTGSALIITGTLSGTGKVLYSGGAAQTIAATTYYDLEFSGAGTKTIADATSITVTNNWIIGSTTSMAGNGSATVTGGISGAGALTMGTGTINLAGAWTKTGTFTAGTGTINYNGATQTIATLAYYKLQTSSNGVKTLAANTTVSSVLTVNSPSEIDLSTFTLTLSGAGTPMVIGGTFTASTSTVSFTNVASTDIPAVNFYNLTGTGGPRVFANSGVIGIAGTFTKGAGAYTVAGSTVNFNGGAQTIPAFTFNNLILSGTLQKTIVTATTVNVYSIEIQNGPTLDLPGTAQLNITKP